MTQRLVEQGDSLFRPGRVDVVYHYLHDQCCPEFFFSNGSEWWTLSLGLGHTEPMHELMRGLATLATGEAAEAIVRCDSALHVGETRLVLCRHDELLDIIVLYFPVFRELEPLPDDEGERGPCMTVDFQTFVKRVRLAASRFATSGS